VVGIGGVVSLVAYGMDVVSRARGETIGLSTAISVAKDPSPLLSPEIATDWSYTPYSMNLASNASSEAKGFINGFYVVRTEDSKYPEDVLAISGGIVYARSARVEVNVYETLNGDAIASYVTRIVRQRGRP
jgi:hypothetical protein